MAYDLRGAAGRPVVVMIEGLGAQLVGWRDGFVDRFVQAGYQVLRLDNRDVGGSQRYPGVAYTVADMAADVHGLLDALDLDHAHVVGQSMGGMIAQEVALQRPERVLSLTLFYTAASLEHPTSSDRDAEVLAALPVPMNREEFVAQYLDLEQACDSPAYPPDLEWRRALGGLLWDRGYDVDGVVRQREAVDRSDDRLTRLGTLDVPTLVIHGQDDRLIPPAAGRDVASAIPGAELVIYPGMGHQLPVALWDDFVPRVLGVMRRGDVRPADVPA